VEQADERFTSHLAMQAMIDGGVKKSGRRNKSLMDGVSATIILQSYLEQKKYV
jgi:putative Holliday junction resolvase